ncbi:hypothetical protein JNUCC1_00543 [Lentibacillus sp. JNUCC-1]|uniref:DUF2642 domain-containing protein n=1 Tax=Lentibacillus sp. JNUCC-1 TaxID=2654513 RepID=UPI00132CB18B|nr:DUF2642 domain-containing protein [Lentibacillus sp. JNUCC-1]MUV36739.1 hypothetical protein [Lentibacillus sp. JNUCC-1]
MNGYYYPNTYGYPTMPQPPVDYTQNMKAYTEDEMRKHHGHNTKLNPIVQPEYVNHKAADYTGLKPVAQIPQPNRYVTNVDPVFLDHLSRHQGLEISVQTTAKEVKGTLNGVAIDHIEIGIGKNKALHIRLDQIVYFEGMAL